MNLANNIGLNIYSIVLLLIIFVHTVKKGEKVSLQRKIFVLMLIFTALLLVVDILGRYDGNPGTYYEILNRFGNFILYSLNLSVQSFWLYYVITLVENNRNRLKMVKYILIGINSINLILVILTQFYGWYYYIDSGNIYHRGPLFMLAAVVATSMIIAALIIIIINRRKFEKKYVLSLIFFAVPPLLCIIIQTAVYGISLMLNGVTLSLLIVFLSMQNHSIHTDYLTELNNRKKLDIYLRDKINGATENKTFSAIMLDINNFKMINDTYGHETGDIILRTAANLLYSCLKPNDFIARFGGDEFFIVLNISSFAGLEKVVEKIQNHIEKYNENNNNSFSLGFSMGYAVYDYTSHMKIEDFEKKLDKLMYEDKQAEKEHKD